MAWTNEPEFDGAEGREIVSNGVLIATVYNATDAALIAAAPDLLAALKDASAYIEKCSYVDRIKWLAVQDAVNTAIAKAKGN